MTELSIRLLGPVEAHRSGQVLPLGGPMPRGVMALLALTPGLAVGSEALIEALWGPSAPATARGTLSAHVSRLRSRGLGPAIRHGTGGYVLDVAPQQVDLHRAEAAHARARVLLLGGQEGALEALDAATAEWRGTAVAGLDGLAFVPGLRRRLEQRREAVRRDRVDALLAAGRAQAVLDGLAAEARRQPHSERVWGQLIRALHADGRRVEAMAAYQQVATALREDLGLDPSEALEDLHRALLRGDLDASRPLVARAGPMRPPETAVDVPRLVGREAELAALRDLAADVRAVTLVGLSGIGKSRLAAAHLAGLAEVLADGPWTCDLHDVAEPDEVPGRIARALGLEQPDLGAAAAAVGRRRTVLLLDGVDRVGAAAADAVEALLAACPGLSVVVTAPAALGVAGEAVLPVGPLDAAGPASPAVELLRRAGGGAAAAGQHAAVALAQALDGIPLAIELAARHVGHRPLDDLLDLVAHDGAALHGGGRGAPARHRTLEAAIRWSVDALEPHAAAALSAAAVFVDGAHPAAVAEVLAGAGVAGPAVQDGLAQLAARGLVQRRRGPADPRIHLLDAVRRQQQAARPARTTADLLDAHARWARRLAARADAGLRTSAQCRWWARLAAEEANLRAAIAHGLHGGDPATSVAIAGHLAWWWNRRGDLADGIAVLRRCLAAAPDAPLPDRTRALAGIGVLAFNLGDAGGMAEAVRGVAAAAADPQADRAAVARTAVLAAYAAVLRDDLAGAAAALAPLDETALPPVARRELLIGRAFVAGAAGDADGALHLLGRAIDLAARDGDWWADGSGRWLAAKLHVDRGDGDAAASLLRPALRRPEAALDRTGPLTSCHVLAAALALAGEPEQGALVLAGVDHVGARLGFHPVRMDPRDAPRHRALVAGAVDNDTWDRAQAAGAGLTYEGLLALAVA